MPETELDAAIRAAGWADADPAENSAILKDEDRCIRCALCADALSGRRDHDGTGHHVHDVEVCMTVTPTQNNPTGSRLDPEPVAAARFPGAGGAVGGGLGAVVRGVGHDAPAEGGRAVVAVEEISA